ncbi:MAG: methyltransferase [Pyrinomonadaceae bacterium]
MDTLTTQSRTVMGNARRALAVFKRRFPSLYRRLFFENERIRYCGELLYPIQDLGIVVRDGEDWRSPFIVTVFDGLFIVTDPFTLSDQNRVFALSSDESFLLARKLALHEKDVVLDVGTGSGIQALHAATRSKYVVATDINHKALRYARFNVALNGLDHKIEICYSDVFQHLNGARFDLILSNPPVVPTPEGSGFFTHSDGGPLGMSVSTRVLTDGASHLKPGGRIQMLSISFSNEQGVLLVSESMKQVYEQSTWRFDLLELYNPPLERLITITDRFRHVPLYPSWIGLLESNRCKRLHYLYVHAVADSERFSLEHRVMKQPQNRTAYCGSWEARLSRLFLAYHRNITSELASKRQVASAAGSTF